MKAEPTEHQRADRVGPLRLSFAQERLWFLEQLRPGTAMYNLPLVFWLRGQVDEEALRGAVSDVVGSIKSLLNAVVVIVTVLWLLNIFGLFHSLSRMRVGT